MDVRELLSTGAIAPRGMLANASNHTVLVEVGATALGVFAVYKPAAGERPLWDFASGTLCQREAAAFLVSEHLGWDLVPVTVLREDGPLGRGSLQQFVPHDPGLHYFVLVDDPDNHPVLARMALFDLLVNNADRKASHVLLADDGRIRGCDHGLAFHAQPKLRTVIWDLGGYAVEPRLRTDLARLSAALDEQGSGLRTGLAALLSAAELSALARRAEVLQGLRALPQVEEDRRPYPWPLL